MKWTEYAQHPALVEFVPVEQAGSRALVRRGYEPHTRLLIGFGATTGIDEWVHGGRTAHPLVTIGARSGERALIRGYRRGGFLRHFNRERYFGGHRSFAELLATEAARAAGVNVPVVLAAAERPSILGYRATLATRWVAGTARALQWLSRADGGRDRVLERIGDQIARMHAGGIGHPDLNLRNLLIAGDAEGVTILDFDRARLHEGPVPGSERSSDLLRFGRSARKFGAELGSRGWAALARGYGPDWPLKVPRG